MVTDTETRLRKLVASQLNVEPDLIEPHVRFGDDLRADSLDTVEMSMAAEEEFEIEMSDDEALDAFAVESTFEKACKLIDQKRAERVA